MPNTNTLTIAGDGMRAPEKAAAKGTVEKGATVADEKVTEATNRSPEEVDGGVSGADVGMTLSSRNGAAGDKANTALAAQQILEVILTSILTPNLSERL